MSCSLHGMATATRVPSACRAHDPARRAAGVPLDLVLSLLPTKSLANAPLIGAGLVPPVSVQVRSHLKQRTQ